MDVRRAAPLDISAIIALLMEMHKNTEIPASPISSEKLVAKISESIHRGIVFVAIDEKNEILGSIGGIISTDWWSDERHLSDMWFYVSKASRKTRVAYELVKNFIGMAKEAKVPGKYFIKPIPNIVIISFPIFLFIFTYYILFKHLLIHNFLITKNLNKLTFNF